MKGVLPFFLLHAYIQYIKFIHSLCGTKGTQAKRKEKECFTVFYWRPNEGKKLREMKTLNHKEENIRLW